MSEDELKAALEEIGQTNTKLLSEIITGNVIPFPEVETVGHNLCSAVSLGGLNLFCSKKGDFSINGLDINKDQLYRFMVEFYRAERYQRDIMATKESKRSKSND